MSAESLAELLASRLPSGLASRARAMQKIQGELERALPAGLVGHVRVMQLNDEGILRVACASGAIASRLRHQTGALQAALAKRGISVSSVRIRVDPGLAAPYVPPPEKASLPEAALDDLARLKEEIADGPLKDALGRLLRHHRAG
ncbi:MAG TPA: DciA family protein [Thiobacillaceae bacterium]|nr:DciA family protein [Thiobacillaceae bacterium]